MRCYPPGDARPNAKQIKACKPYLEREIEVAKPEIIVTLGAVALQAIVGKQVPLKDYLNRLHTTGDGVRLFALLHPAAILHDPRREQELRAGFRILAHRVLGPKGDNGAVSLAYIETPDEMAAWLATLAGPVAFDYETTGLWPTKHAARLASIVGRTHSGELQARVVQFSTRRARKAWAMFLRNRIPKIAHNAAFEVHWSRCAFGQEVRNLTGDTKLREYLIDERRPNSLDVMAVGQYGVSPWDEGLKSLRETTDWAEIPDEQLAPYCAGDSSATLISYEKQELAKNQELLETISLRAAEALASMRENGLCIDLKALQRRATEAKELRDKIGEELTEMSGEEINWHSPTQVRQVLFEKLKLPVVKETPKGQPSADKEALEELAGSHPVLDKYTEYRAAKSEVIFLAALQKNVHPDGCVRSDYQQAYTQTGRLSSREPNLQNVSPVTKKVFTSRYPQGVLCQADYSQLELRLAACLSGEPGFLSVYTSVPEGDLHQQTAEVLYPGKEISSEMRVHAKRINFGILYGLGPRNLARHMGVDETRASRHIERYRRRYGRLMSWIRAVESTTERDGFARNKLGRVRHLPDAQLIVPRYEWTPEKDAKFKAFRQAVNFHIQSLGSDITCWAMARVDRALRARQLLSLLCAQVHDSILVDVYPGERDEVMDIIKQEMEVEANRVFAKILKGVPLRIDLSVGKTWAELEEVEWQNESSGKPPRRSPRGPRRVRQVKRYHALGSRRTQLFSIDRTAASKSESDSPDHSTKAKPSKSASGSSRSRSTRSSTRRSTRRSKQ